MSEEFNKPQLIGINEKDENLIFTHAQDIEPAMREAYRLRQVGDGFTEDRSMRHVGRIPLVVFEMHPEFLKDTDALMKWLRSPEGAPYRTVRKGL